MDVGVFKQSLSASCVERNVSSYYQFGNMGCTFHFPRLPSFSFRLWEAPFPKSSHVLPNAFLVFVKKSFVNLCLFSWVNSAALLIILFLCSLWIVIIVVFHARLLRDYNKVGYVVEEQHIARLCPLGGRQKFQGASVTSHHTQLTLQSLTAPLLWKWGTK